jgi:hypothetical protein
MTTAVALYPVVGSSRTAVSGRPERVSILADKIPFESHALERIRTFFDSYIRRNIPPFSLTRYYLHGQIPRLSNGQTNNTFDLTLRRGGVDTLIHNKRLSAQGNLNPSDWQQVFETLEYGDCQHVASYVHSVLSSPHGAKQLRGLLPPVIGIIIKDSDLKRLQTLYKEKFGDDGRALSEVNEEALFHFKRLCASNDIEIRHMFNVLNLPEEVKAEMKTQNSGDMETPYIVQPDLSDLDGAVIVDGWALQLADQVFTASDARKAYEHFFADGKYKLVLVSDNRGIGKIFLN